MSVFVVTMIAIIVATNVLDKKNGEETGKSGENSGGNKSEDPA